MENAAIGIEKEYPDEFEFDVKLEARINRDRDSGYVGIYIPAIDQYFSAPSEDEAKRRCSLHVKAWIRFWTEANNKGIFKGVEWDKK